MTSIDAGTALVAAAAAFIAGAVNAVAGGGTLLSFPALLALGVPPLAANVTNTVGLLPGYVGGSAAYRRELRGQGRRLALLAPAGAVGAVAGALLLVHTPPGVFRAVVPWLILASCALLAAQPLVASRLLRAARGTRRSLLAGGQAVAGVYGAFFGAGLGVLTLALLGLVLDDTLQRLNALKGASSFVVNVVAAALFALLGPVAWLTAAVMAPAAFLGGFAGVAVARRMHAGLLRVVVIAAGVAVAVRLLV